MKPMYLQKENTMQAAPFNSLALVAVVAAVASLA